MSLHECIQIYHPLDIPRYLKALREDYQAIPHPKELNAFLVGTPPLPFHHPHLREGYVSILSFNYAPLPYALLEVLVHHPEIVPAKTWIVWTFEQHLLTKGTLQQLQAEWGSSV